MSDWKRIGLVVSNAKKDINVLKRAKTISQYFEAQIAVFYAGPESESLPPWFGEGMIGNFNQDILTEIQKFSQETYHNLAEILPTLGFETQSLIRLSSPLWQSLSHETRLCDLMIFDHEAATGKGLMGEAFQQVLMDDQAAVYVARQDIGLNPRICVAWYGSLSSTRAAKLALPWLKTASQIVIATAPIGDEPADPLRLQSYFHDHNIKAEIMNWPPTDVRISLKKTLQDQGFDLLVAGGFGHSRFHEFVFGGTTRYLLHDESVNLFLAH